MFGRIYPWSHPVLGFLLLGGFGLLIGISARAPLPMGTWSAKFCCTLIAVSPVPFPGLYLTLLVIPRRWYLSGSPKKHPGMLVKLNVHTGLFFSTEETVGPGGSSLTPAWGVAMWSSETIPLALHMQFFSGFCGPQWWFSLTLVRDLQRHLLYGYVLAAHCVGHQNQEPLYFTILLMSHSFTHKFYLGKKRWKINKDINMWRRSF